MEVSYQMSYSRMCSENQHCKLLVSYILELFPHYQKCGRVDIEIPSFGRHAHLSTKHSTSRSTFFGSFDSRQQIAFTLGVHVPAGNVDGTTTFSSSRQPRYSGRWIFLITAMWMLYAPTKIL